MNDNLSWNCESPKSVEILPNGSGLRPVVEKSKSGRRQGIFWILTVPATSEYATKLAGGEFALPIVWYKGQKEKGEKTGYLHYQMVVAFSKKVSLSAVVKLFGRGVHAELSRSECANTYCGKEETRVGESFEYGAKPFCRNSKTDWETVWESAKKGDLMSIPAHTRVVSYRSLLAIFKDHAEPRAIERKAFVFWGRTGTGKSRRAWDEAGIDAFPKDPRSKFWDGYRGQKHVVVDEFRGGIDIAHVLRWLDRYPVMVEVKGSSRPLDAERIWFTSNLEPSGWYPEVDSATMDALLRRIDVISFNE